MRAMKTMQKQVRVQNWRARLVIALYLLLLSSPGVWAQDADNDFMEDQWEVQHGLDPGDAGDAFLDLDNDGFVNLCEYLHTSDPNDAGQLPVDNITLTVPTQVGTIQHAIDMSIDGDTVLIQPGSYEEALNVSDREIRIRGSAPKDPAVVAATVINPNNIYYDIVNFISSQQATSILEGVTLTGGQRGVYCHGQAAPTIAHCVIKANSNTGLYINGFADTDVHVSHCRVIGNGSNGVVCNNSRLHLHHTVVAKNGNTGGVGVVLNGGDAGGSRIHNCTIVGHGSRGIRTSNIGNGQADIINCIVWDNQDDLYDCVATFSCIQDGDPGQGNRAEDPRFVNLAANDFRILPESLCIDAGAPWSDYNAESAPHGNRINMGAYGNSSLAALSSDTDGDGISDNWERHYWPADDPSAHSPEEDTDADGFDNRTEYLYGYNPIVASQESLGLVKAQVHPEQFDPTAQEALTIHYWLNTDADSTIHMAADTDPNHALQSMTHIGLTGENTLQWNGRDPNGDILDRGRYLAVVDVNANGSYSQAQSNTSQLSYDHRVLELFCQPERFFPLHNDVIQIAYDASPDADMLIRIYDPNEKLFCSYAIEASEPNEILWQGTDKDLGDPAGRYLSQPGPYRIEALFQGMHEKNETTVEAYR
jgi:hypothetical protein